MLREKNTQNKGYFVRIILMSLCVCVFLSETEEREKRCEKYLLEKSYSDIPNPRRSHQKLWPRETRMGT